MTIFSKNQRPTGWKIFELEVTPSTNDLAKEAGRRGENFTAYIAEEQTSGRGRLNRAFYSPKGRGLYMSALFRPHVGATDCGRLTAYVAVVTARAIEKLSGERAEIKWVNDVYMRGKKVAGILTEGEVRDGNMSFAVVGVGVNVTGEMPCDLTKIATSVEEASGVRISRADLATEILNGLACAEAQIRNPEFVKEYRERSCVIGKRVKVDGVREATVVGIDDDCALLLDFGEGVQKFSDGEVSIKI